MTLQEFFELLGNNPAYVLFYFGIIPIAAFLAGILGKNEGHLSPWKYLYGILIYLVCVPGLFAVVISVYQFLFGRGSILNADVLMQVLPICSMVVTLLIIRRNVDLDHIPGFDKITGLLTMILAVFAIMWFIDRTRIVVFSYLPFTQVLLIFVVLLLVIRYGWKKSFGSRN